MLVKGHFLLSLSGVDLLGDICVQHVARYLVVCNGGSVQVYGTLFLQVDSAD